MRRLVSPTRLGALALTALAALTFTYVWPSNEYLFLPARAQPLAPQVLVEGERPGRDGGGIYYVAVNVRQATLLESWFPSVYEGSTLLHEKDVRPPGVSENARREAERDAMRRSQRIAAAVALDAAGYDVTIRPAGAVVTAIGAGTPAVGKLRPSDIIVAVDGSRIRTPQQLARAIQARRPGERVEMRIRRGGRERELTLRTAASPDPPRRAIVGIGIDQAADIRLPVRVQIDLGNVGGPSAGLAFALDILEELGRDVDRGRKIAATGEIALDGSVGRVGGVKQKTIGARRADVDVLLVPGDNEAEARRYADGLRVVPVHNFRQALRALATVAETR